METAGMARTRCAATHSCYGHEAHMLSPSVASVYGTKTFQRTVSEDCADPITIAILYVEFKSLLATLI